MILLDLVAWVALLYDGHIHHGVAKAWVDKQTEDLLLCRVTQLGILRMMSNAAVMGEDVVTRAEAWRAVDQLLSDERVRWSDEPANLDAVFRTISARPDRSHRLWTDDYLAAFAQASGASLATLDTKLKRRYPSVRVEQLI